MRNPQGLDEISRQAVAGVYLCHLMRDEGIVERVAELKAQVPAKADILSAFEHISYENS